MAPFAPPEEGRALPRQYGIFEGSVLNCTHTSGLGTCLAFPPPPWYTLDSLAGWDVGILGVNRKQTESWAGSGETRHSFKMEINGTTYRWGHKEKDKGQPNLTTDNSYYNLYQLALGTDPWDYSFRFCDELLQWGEKQGNVYYATVKTDVTLYFNAEFGTYTHRWVASETNED